MLKFRIAGNVQTQTFLIAPIDVHSIILGMPWLEYTNPTIDWRLKTVQFDSSSSSQSHVGKSSNAEESETPEILPVKSEITTPRWIGKRKSKNSRISKENPLRLPKAKPVRLPPKVRLTTKINSNDEIHLLHLDGILCLSEYLSAIHEEAQANPSPIPQEYADLAEVFSKYKAHELPPNRGPLDHHIHLQEGSKPVFGPIYNLSEMELKVLKEYINENL